MRPARRAARTRTAGRRQAKKRRVRAHIIETALGLFRRHGYEETRVYDITHAADLSEATFFNYFPTKDAVLGAWIQDWLGAAFEARGDDAATGSIRRPFREAVREIAKQVSAEPDFMADVWRRVRWSAVANGETTRPPEPSGAERLLAAAQQHGHLRRDVSSEQLAELLTGTLFATIAGWLVVRVSGEGPREGLERRLSQAVDLLLDGSRKRNERVHHKAAARTR